MAVSEKMVRAALAAALVALAMAGPAGADGIGPGRPAAHHGKGATAVALLGAGGILLVAGAPVFAASAGAGLAVGALGMGLAVAGESLAEGELASPVKAIAALPGLLLGLGPAAAGD